MQFLYRLIYQPWVNAILLRVLKLIPGLPQKYQLPPSGTMEVSLKNGKSFLLKTNQTCFVTVELFWRGLYDYEYAEIFESLFHKTEVFFDVGSNIGLFSIMAGKINPEMKVFAFDPSPGPFDYLSENVRINKLANLKPLQMALSNQNGSFSFEIILSITILFIYSKK
jgi:ribosomal protein L11 methylase PrmA